MGARKVADRAETVTGTGSRKRRRKGRARTDVSSSSESSDDDSNDEDVEMKDVVTVSKSVEKDMAPKTTFDSNSDSSSDTSSVGDEDEVVTKKILTEKSGTIPSQLRDLQDPQAAARFEEYYMHLITAEFGDDLDSLRQSKDFSEKSLPMLVRALKQGVNIFEPEEMRVAIGGGGGAK